MIKRIGIAVVAALAVSVAAHAADVTDKGYFGNWKLNHDKSSASAGAPPPNRESTRHHEDLGNGFVLVQTKGVNANGASTFQSYVVKADGKHYPMAAQNQTAPQTMMFTFVDAYTVTYVASTNGKPNSSTPGRRTVSKDGKTMTLDQTGTNAQGQSYTTHSVFDKQ